LDRELSDDNFAREWRMEKRVVHDSGGTESGEVRMRQSKRYVVITPVRDEGQHIEKTILSMLAQTIQPDEWIIIDDGSTDDTGAIIDKYANQCAWIRTLHRENRGFRKSGGGVVEAFNEGYSMLASSRWEFIVKLDGDLSFAPDYFERVFQYFSDDPQLGIGGGEIYHLIDGQPELEKTPAFHVRGATKVYRRNCWLALGGLIPSPGWDTLDEVKANMVGWRTHCFPELKLIHHKHTGAADGKWGAWVKNGMGSYVSGYHPVFMILKCLKRTFKKPFLISGLGLLYGFFSGYLQGVPQIQDRALICYLRKQQINRILMKESIWK
jgi:biofilm PGA synthesis N-glycosyltransferase PgaC